MAVKAKAPSRAVASLDAMRKQLDKKYGAGTVVTLTGGAFEKVAVIPSGCLQLDAALGMGGFPRGRLTELFGPQSSGKTSLCLSAMQSAQDQGLAVCFMDYEHSFDPFYAQLFGVDIDPDRLLLIQPMSLEEGMQMMETMLQSELVGLVIVDSLAAMATVSELDGDIGDVKMAPQARAMSQALKRLVPSISRSNAAVIFINHVKEVIGGFNPTGQKRYTTPGGSALKFYASVRIELKPMKGIKTSVENAVTGEREQQTTISKVRAQAVKNKCAPPWRSGSIFLQHGRGIRDGMAVLEILEYRGMVARNGSRYILPFKDEDGKNYNLGGTEATLEWFDEHPVEYEKLRKIAYAKLVQALRDQLPALHEQTKLAGHDTLDEAESEIEAELDAPAPLETGIPGKEGFVSVSFGPITPSDEDEEGSEDEAEAEGTEEESADAE